MYDVIKTHMHKTGGLQLLSINRATSGVPHPATLLPEQPHPSPPNLPSSFCSNTHTHTHHVLLTQLNMTSFSYSHVLVVVAAMAVLEVVAASRAVAVISMCSLSLQLVGNFIPVTTCYGSPEAFHPQTLTLPSNLQRYRVWPFIFPMCNHGLL